MPSIDPPCDEGLDQEILGIYATTVRSAVRCLEEHLAGLRAGDRRGASQAALRLVHNLRGSSAQLGFKETAEVAGRMEALVERIGRAGGNEPDFQALAAGIAYLGSALPSRGGRVCATDSREVCRLLDGRLP